MTMSETPGPAVVGRSADRPERLEPEHLTALIPAAGRVQEGILSLSSIATPAMIPVAGLPVIQWSLRYLTDLGVRRFRIAVPHRGLSVEDHVLSVFGSKASFEWIVPSSDRGAGGTVLELLDGVEGPGLVVLGDTLFELPAGAVPGDHPWVLTGAVEDSERWCIVRVGSDGAVREWCNKQPGLSGELHAAAGVYYFPDAELAVRRASQLDGRLGAIDISEVLTLAAADEPVLTVPAGTWRDCGNPDTQELSRRQLLQERSFNSMTFDDRFGTVRKVSSHREKFIDEINFLQLLPRRVRALFPAVVDASTEWDDPWLELDYCAYPTLTELFLYEQLPSLAWVRILERLDAVLGVFAEHPRPVGLGELRAMYLDKTRERLAMCAELPHLRPLIDAPTLVVNGVERTNLPGLLDDASRRVERDAVDAKGCIMHGDLCFSNVLYDVRTGACKLIDPRGSFGRSGIHGDQRYDVAKIHHSVVGAYDHLVAGLFHLDVTGDRVTLEVHLTNAQRSIRELYREHVLDSWIENQIELITGLMFAGLPALHSESAERQIAFYVRAVEMVSDALGDGAGGPR